MRIMSTAMLVEKNRLSSDHPWAHLFQLDIPNAGSFRATAYDQDVIFHGLRYIAQPLRVDTLEDPTHAALVNIRVTLENVSQQVIALLENYWIFTADPQWTVTIWTVDSTMPDEVSFLAGDVFTTQQVTTDFVQGVFDLVGEGLTLSALLPKRRYSASNNFPFLPRR